MVVVDIHPHPFFQEFFRHPVVPSLIGQHMEDPAGTAAPGDPLFHQHGHGAVVGVHSELLQEVGRRGGDLLFAALLNDLPGNMAVIRKGITGHLAMESLGQPLNMAFRLLQQKGHFLWIIDVNSLLAGHTVAFL